MKNKKVKNFAQLMKELSAYAGRTVANDPLQKFMFRVSIPGIPEGMGFQSVNGLSSEIAVIEYFEGGYDSAHKIKGRNKVGQLVLTKGAYASKELENLYKTSLSDRTNRVTIVVSIQDREGVVRRSWTLDECWASKWEMGDLDATSDDVIIETLTIEYERIQ